MKTLILIFASLAVSVLFLLFNQSGQMGFLFSDMVLTPELWFYYLFEHVSVLLLAVALLAMARENRFAFKVFVGIQIVDTLDYALFYGDQWDFSPVPWNVIKISIFSLAIIHQSWKHLAARS